MSDEIPVPAIHEESSMGCMNGKAEGARRLSASYGISAAEAEHHLDAFTDAFEEVLGTDTDMEGNGEV